MKFRLKEKHKDNEAKIWLFEKLSNIDTALAKLTKRKIG